MEAVSANWERRCSWMEGVVEMMVILLTRSMQGSRGSSTREKQ